MRREVRAITRQYFAPLRWLRYQIAWWHWALTQPNPYTLIRSGLDRESRAIVYARHDEKMPHWSDYDTEDRND